MNKKKPHVLFCPLNWGIGHASRSVPLIRHFLEAGAKVTLAGDGHSLAFLKDAFPGLDFITLKGFDVVYPADGRMVSSMLTGLPRMIAGIAGEHHKLKQIVAERSIDIVVSDNRFGMWNKGAYTIYITHQLMIKTPARWKWTEPLLSRAHRFIIDRYDECWVPDHPGDDNLSGDLSHKGKTPNNTQYIGPLSRFAGVVQKPTTNYSYDYAVLLSGPEPQRTILEEKVISQLSSLGKSAFIFRGRPMDTSVPETPPNVKMVAHGTDTLIMDVLADSKMVVCRSGYSTIMDLVALRKKALLVPTPGQTEQEYLARHMKDKGWFDAISQDELDILKIDPLNFPFKPPPDYFHLSLPGSIIRKLLNDHGS